MIYTEKILQWLPATPVFSRSSNSINLFLILCDASGSPRWRLSKTGNTFISARSQLAAHISNSYSATPTCSRFKSSMELFSIMCITSGDQKFKMATHKQVRKKSGHWSSWPFGRALSAYSARSDLPFPRRLLFNSVRYLSVCRSFTNTIFEFLDDIVASTGLADFSDNECTPVCKYRSDVIFTGFFRPSANFWHSLELVEKCVQVCRSIIGSEGSTQRQFDSSSLWSSWFLEQILRDHRNDWNSELENFSWVDHLQQSAHLPHKLVVASFNVFGGQNSSIPDLSGRAELQNCSL